MLQLIGFHVHIGKGLAELVRELIIAGMVVRRLFDVVAVEHFDWRGEYFALVRNEMNMPTQSTRIPASNVMMASWGDRCKYYSSTAQY